MQELIVNEGLRTLPPPQSDEELERLEKSLLEEGCRDPIVVWSGKNIIVDGMTRFRLCCKHEIEFRTTELKFANLSEVKLWIINNQFAKRNCTPTQRSYCFGSLYNSMKGTRGGPRSKGREARGATDEKIAEQVGVSVSRELGFLVESVRTGFPDCEGKRRVNRSGTKWEHVRIEFEYESKNFLLHGHDPNGCDVIVCWVDNWEGRKEGPAKNLEVLELKSEIERLSPK